MALCGFSLFNEWRIDHVTSILLGIGHSIRRRSENQSVSSQEEKKTNLTRKNSRNLAEAQEADPCKCKLVGVID
jgi:hypothetical protein